MNGGRPAAAARERDPPPGYPILAVSRAVVIVIVGTIAGWVG